MLLLLLCLGITYSLQGCLLTHKKVVFSAPFAETDFTAANGAGSIRVDTSVTALKVFRDVLYIFGLDKIYKLAGSSIADFQVQPVTRTLGCADGFSVQELGGDLIFLSLDGLRTIAGTEKIGDVELGTLSKPIQRRIQDVVANRNNITSTVIRGKSQYRIFILLLLLKLPPSVRGVLGTLKRTPQGGVGFEWADIKGLKPSSMDSDFISGVEYVIEGGFDGYVRQQESTTVFTFDGENIIALYRSPDLSLGDAGIRKLMQRVILNYEVEGTIAAELRIRYDSDSIDVPQPEALDITSPGGNCCVWCCCFFVC